MLTWEARIEERERQLVLILILMECSLGVFTTIVEGKEVCGLNPYSNGMLTWFY